MALWVGQVVLFLAFALAGGFKLVTPAAQMAKQSPLPIGLIRFIGTCEVLGAIGVIVPALTRILPILSGIAAWALMVVMVLAVGFHISHGLASSMGPAVFLGIVAGLVGWGRTIRAPIRSRARG